MENLVVQLNHRLREAVQEYVLHRADLIVIIGVGFEVGGAEGECAVESMLLVIGAGAINRLVGGGIHEDLAGACEKLLRLG